MKILKNHRSGGTSGMWAEHLKEWLAATKSKERGETAAKNEHPTEERTKEGPNGMGGEETAESREGDTYGGVQLGEGGGTRPDIVQGGATGGGGHVAGSSPAPQGGKGLLWHWPHGGDVEGSGGDFKFPAQSLHHLPRIPPRIYGGSRHRYRHPRGQTASAVSGLEGGGPVRDLPGPAQGV